MSMPLRIEKLYAWTMVDPKDNTEGVVGVKLGTSWYPLIGADKERIESYRHLAEESARLVGAALLLKEFDRMRVMETIEQRAS